MKILTLSPHPDDAELGCGGSIARLVEGGHEVYSVIFSTCRQSLPPGRDPETLRREAECAASELGIKRENLIILDHPVRRFFEKRQEILDDLIAIGGKIRPDMVFMPSKGDVHQDHAVIACEGLRAFKHTTILCYEQPWNNLRLMSNVFITLQRRHIDKKLSALAKYESQKLRPYFAEGAVESAAAFMGLRSGAEYAESFELVKCVI
jgi:LmbE family N-acetylglucosaminyl deacetylase